MNNNDSGTRSFEPVQPKQQRSAKPTNKAKPTPQKITAIAIFTVVIAIIVLFCAIIIAEIAYKVGGVPGDDNVNGALEYTEITVSSADSEKGELIIVNKQNPMSDALKIEVSQTIKNVLDYNTALKAQDSSHAVYYKYLYPDNDKNALLPAVIDKFNRMTTALYNETGCGDILFAYGYLNPNQSTLDCDYIHQAGMTVDLKLKASEDTLRLSSNPTVYSWLNENCSKFGFINSYPVVTDDGYRIENGMSDNHGSDEQVASAQFRYVGVAHATYITEQSLTIDDYAALLKASHNGHENALSITGADGNSYLVYYVAASNGSETTLSVPEKYSYTVSGDNMGGFIVTVNLSEKIN